MHQKIRRYSLILLSFICCLIIALPVFPQDQQTAFRILFINSYHRGYSWSDGIEEGLRQRLAEADPDIELSIEFLDSRRFNYGKQMAYIAQAMAVKYTDYRPDLVVVADNAAFDFAIQHRQQLFADIPIVFCGYNNFRPDVLQGISNITGVNEEIAIMNTVNMALQMHPQTDTLAFVLSTGEESSQRIKEVAEQSVLPELRQRFQVVTLEDASVEDIEQTLAGLPANTVLFLSGQARDKGLGRALSPAENGHLITQVSPFPAYTFWDFHLNQGAIGGRIITGPEQGIAAADLALRILAGEAADTIPVVMTTPTQDIFDYEVMTRFGITPRDLPVDVQILNQPFSVWNQYRWQIVGILALVTVQTLLIGLLLRLARERRLVLRDLHKEQERLEERVAERTIELQAANDQLARLSTTDALTGLANRRQFDQVLEDEYLRMLRCHHPLSLILLDVDHFKRFNDCYGHVIGDKCLHQIGQAIYRSIRHPLDLAARYGGEEFAIILPETYFQNVNVIAERIRVCVEQLQIPHAYSDRTDHVTVSLGVVTIEASTVCTAPEIVQLADQQLYKAKMQGRNQVVAQNLVYETLP
jgi:diguanylate cyclase (GGDEF)-like protein